VIPMWKRDRPDVPAADIATVEAPTAQEALERVTGRFGSRAEIIGARKVLRGGIAGFFAKEMIQLRVRTPAADDVGGSVTERGGRTDAPARPGRSSAGPDGGPGQPAVTRLLEALTDSVDDRERTFAQQLRGHLAAGAAQWRGSEDGEPAAGVAAPQATSLADFRSTVSGSVFWRSHAQAVASGALSGAARPRHRPAAAQAPPPGPFVLAKAPSAASPAPASASAPAAAQTPAPGPAPAPAEPAPAPEAAAAATGSATIALLRDSAAGDTSPGGVGKGPWDQDALRALDLPDLVVDALDGVGDDLEALRAVASAVVSLCRPLPTGTPMLLGPRAGTLSPELEIPLVLPPGPTPAAGPVAAKVGKKHRQWVDRYRGDRWLHLVVGGRGWDALRDVDALAVSWTTTEDLPAALRLAADGGLVLGFDATRGLRRASPEDVAITLRELLVTR
jgi:hypothetical protein